jgi:hypothetical protein
MRPDDVDEQEVDEEEVDDEDEEPAEEELAEDVRRKVLAALPGVIAKLGGVAIQGRKFGHDDARHACAALLRLAPKLIARERRAARDDSWLGYHPRHTPEQAAALLRRIQREEARAARGEPEDPNWEPL